MNYNIKFLLTILIIIFLQNCTERIEYTGKIFDNKIFDISSFKTKDDILNTLGDPNYIDPIEKKLFYISQKEIYMNFFDKEIVERRIIVFTFNDQNMTTSSSEYNLDDENKIKLVNSKTENLIVERGIIEKIFGGVGIGSGYGKSIQED